MYQKHKTSKNLNKGLYELNTEFLQIKTTENYMHDYISTKCTKNVLKIMY